MSLIFRDQIAFTDREHIKTLVIETQFFSLEEINVAIELVDDKLTKNEKSDYHFLMVEDSEKPNTLEGFCCYGHIPGTLSSYRLYWIAVDKNSQNQKVGKKILVQLEERIIQLGGTRLYAETSGRELYRPTHEFYLRTQFILEARLKDFFAPGDDELIFSKVLGNTTDCHDTIPSLPDLLAK